MSDEKPIKLCKDCANFKAPDQCFMRYDVNVINGEKLPVYIDCQSERGFWLTRHGDHCGPDAKRFVPAEPKQAPAHRSSLGFILDRFRVKQ